MHPYGLQGPFGCEQDGGCTDDDTSRDDFLCGFVQERLLPRHESKPENPVAEVFHIVQTGNVNVRHNGRLDKRNSHDVAPQEPSSSSALIGENHASGPTTRYRSHHNVRFSQSVIRHGQQTVPCPATDPRISVASARKRFAQIADQSPRHGIGQDQSTNDAPFIGMVHPGYQPQISIDGFDINASSEAVEDNHRFYQRNRFVIRHRASQVGIAA